MAIKSTCAICKEEIDNAHFSRHIKKSHSLSVDEYKDKFNLRKYCLCGCGTEILKSYCSWVWGHHSRINNISKREDIRKLRSEKMKEWHDSGTWVAWNKGVSDDRTKKNGENSAKTKNSKDEKTKQEIREKLSQSRIKGIQEGTIKVASGSKSSRWKGGRSPIHAILHSNYDLYKFWRRPILIRDNFQCTECTSTKDLQVHHNKETMSEVMAKFVSPADPERTWEEKQTIVKQIIQYHIDNNVSGITICKACHKNIHGNLNF